MSNSTQYINKLRSSGLRPTRQRIKICEILFNSGETFHFTVKELAKMIENQVNIKVSLATIYNTVHAFNDKGYLKEIAINSSQSYFDTNTSIHHHFYDEDTHELIDCNENDIDPVNVKKNITGKKINSVEVLIKVASDYQNQK